MINPSNGFVTTSTATRNIMPYPITSSFNRMRLISGGSVFAVGSYPGVGGKKIAVIESSWTGLNCLTTGEVFHLTIALSLGSASTIVQNSLAVLPGPLSSSFSSFVLPSNASLVLFAL